MGSKFGGAAHPSWKLNTSLSGEINSQSGRRVNKSHNNTFNTQERLGLSQSSRVLQVSGQTDEAYRGPTNSISLHFLCKLLTSDLIDWSILEQFKAIWHLSPIDIPLYWTLIPRHIDVQWISSNFC